MYNSVRITGQKRLLYSLDKFGFLIFSKTIFISVKMLINGFFFDYFIPGSVAVEIKVNELD